MLPPILDSVPLYSLFTGPYAPAILRFQVSFPPSYPTLPPLVTFFTDVFHPLLTPLTTYTYTAGSSDADTVSATDDQRLPPGGFSLRHGFPHWFGRAPRFTLSSREADGSAVGSPAQNVTPVRAEFGSATADASGAARPSIQVSMPMVLDYIRSTFSEESVLDSIPLEAAANPSAYHAWRANRSPFLQTQQSALNIAQEASDKTPESPALGRNRRPGEWNWEGVWEERVKKAVNASLSESTLFGAGAGEDIVRLLSMGKDTSTLNSCIDSLPQR